MSRSASLERRVATAAGEVLAREKAVSAIDVCVGLGWLHGRHVESWRYGRVGSLSEFLPVDDTRLTDFHDCLSRWAQATGLEPVEADYVSATRDRRPLLFTASAAPAAERAWRTRWIPAGLPVAARERVVQRQEKPPDLVVVMPVKDWQCAECGGTGDLLTMDSAGPLCMTCADLDHLVFLGAGDAALTRRAKKGSALSAVVVRWSRTRKRYERQGILVEEAALEAAEQACLADEDVRIRRRERDRERRAREDVDLQAQMAGEITRLFPRCPPARAEAIARHTALRGSGRVGRSAAGRSLDADALTLAVVASVRHQDTDYDDLLMSGVPRAEARDQIRPAIDRLLAAWSLSQPEPGFASFSPSCGEFSGSGTCDEDAARLVVPRCLIVRIRLRCPVRCPEPGTARDSRAGSDTRDARCRFHDSHRRKPAPLSHRAGCEPGRREADNRCHKAGHRMRHRGEPVRITYT